MVRRLPARAAAGLVLAIGLAGAAPAWAAPDPRDCALFRAAVDRLTAEGRMPSGFGAPATMAVWHFALSQPYPDKPLRETVVQAFPDLAGVAGRFTETNLPAGAAYGDFDETDDSDGYRPVCAWYRSEGRDWTRSATTFGYRLTFFRPSVSRDGRSAVMNLTITSTMNYGHSVHTRRVLRVLCLIEKRGRSWRAAACRDVA